MAVKRAETSVPAGLDPGFSSIEIAASVHPSRRVEAFLDENPGLLR